MTGRRRSRCLVVGYNGTAPARNAVEWAAYDLRRGDRLVIVYASQMQTDRLTPPVPHVSSRAQGRALLDELFMDGSETLVSVRSSTEVLDASPVAALLDAAHRHDANAIVVGTRHRKRLRGLSGSVSRALLQAADRPVFAVPLDGVREHHQTAASG